MTWPRDIRNQLGSLEILTSDLELKADFISNRVRLSDNRRDLEELQKAAQEAEDVAVEINKELIDLLNQLQSLSTAKKVKRQQRARDFIEAGENSVREERET